MSRSLYDKLYRRFGTTLPQSEIAARSAKLMAAERVLGAASATSPACAARLKQLKVAVVGGGFAGVMAAWQLCQRDKGIEVVLFEAGTEVGGRVLSATTFTEGRVIDFGAELIGANHPTWLNLATALGVTLITRTSESDYELFGLAMKFRVDGKDIDPKTAKKLNEDMENVFLEFAKDARLILNADHPWTQPDLRKFDSLSVADKLTKPAPLGLGLRLVQRVPL